MRTLVAHGQPLAWVISERYACHHPRCGHGAGGNHSSVIHYALKYPLQLRNVDHSTPHQEAGTCVPGNKHTGLL